MLVSVQCGAAEKAVSVLCCPRVELCKWFHAVLSLAPDIMGGGPELLPILFAPSLVLHTFRDFLFSGMH